MSAHLVESDFFLKLASSQSYIDNSYDGHPGFRRAAGATRPVEAAWRWTGVPCPGRQDLVQQARHTVRDGADERPRNWRISD